ncbi:hypothetical protein E2C01_020845 [Portunus trituberculatus]|uniref:Uncharacterized protein n=1 Tax=Portunus trituberculatus TaxID=210409 RepID=A0A5B7E1N5_PORTR|nr:hypothetical protein [Portunus trituberculatus]
MEDGDRRTRGHSKIIEELAKGNKNVIMKKRWGWSSEVPVLKRGQKHQLKMEDKCFLNEFVKGKVEIQKQAFTLLDLEGLPHSCGCPLLLPVRKSLFRRPIWSGIELVSRVAWDRRLIWQCLQKVVQCLLESGHCAAYCVSDIFWQGNEESGATV